MTRVEQLGLATALPIGIAIGALGAAWLLGWREALRR
jgi:hypothetical protein